MKNKPHSSLRRRIIVNFCLFTLTLSLIFSGFTFLFLYSVEDEFLNRELQLEADYLVSQIQSGGQFPQSRRRHMNIYQSPAEFPADLAKNFMEGDTRVEYFGEEGRHYHIKKLLPGEDYYLVAEVSQHLIIRPLSRPILYTLGTMAFLMTLLACYIAYRLANRTIGPLSRLAALVGDADPKNLPTGFSTAFPANEIGVLARTLEQAMVRIGQFITREQHFNRDVSHDLRTPLAVVGGAVELMQQSGRLGDKDQKLLDRIDGATRQMCLTVEILLQLAREETPHKGRISIRPRPIVEKIVIQNAALLEKKDVSVQIDIEDHALLRVEQGVLEILLSNLIGNAFHYTTEGKVTIDLLGSTVTVSDTAGGVEAHIQDQVLEPLVKGSKSVGFGLGLSIVKRLCEHHGLGLHIDHDPRGTRFSITFPDTSI